MKINCHHVAASLLATLLLAGCSDSGVSIAPSVSESLLDDTLRTAINESQSDGIDSLIIPDGDALDSIPQDASNVLSHSKVELGKMLFHDTGMAVATNPNGEKSWSCATCHHAAAGFKAGIPQGIGEGGAGFGVDGSARTLKPGFVLPDLQPLGTPTVLNSAYQDVMLWNGQFGNTAGGVNSTVDAHRVTTIDTPKAENLRMLSGLETQAIAGLAVHRLDTDGDYVLNQNEEYRQLFSAAFGSLNTDDYHRDAGLAIAAYERTILANKAPFQLWLRGDMNAMSDSQKRGASLFFNKAACSDCHQGPALSSLPGASEDDMFFAIGMNDFDVNHTQVHGTVAEADTQGRGGFTGRTEDMYKFKIPQLYNLSDNTSLGHGARFATIKDVIRYKNNGVAQNPDTQHYLDSRFTPLNLTETEMDDLANFISDGLYDADLIRYAPTRVPSGACITAGSMTAGC